MAENDLPFDPLQQRYMPHLNHIREYMRQSGLGLDEITGVTMMATVCAVRDQMSAVPKHRDRVIQTAADEFRRKLRRFIVT